MTSSLRLEVFLVAPRLEGRTELDSISCGDDSIGEGMLALLDLVRLDGAKGVGMEAGDTARFDLDDRIESFSFVGDF